MKLLWTAIFAALLLSSQSCMPLIIGGAVGAGVVGGTLAACHFNSGKEVCLSK